MTKVYPIKKERCSICLKHYEGHGNNSYPVKEGRCCDKCNGKVTIVRLRNYLVRSAQTLN